MKVELLSRKLSQSCHPSEKLKIMDHNARNLKEQEKSREDARLTAELKRKESVGVNELPGPRKSMGKLTGRKWNTPGKGELDWISIAEPVASSDTKYQKVLENREKILEPSLLDLGSLNNDIKNLRVKRLEAKHGKNEPRRRKKRRSDINTVISSPSRWNVETIPTKESFLNHEYHGDLFSNRGNYTSGMMYMSRNLHGSAHASPDSREEQYAEILKSIEAKIQEIETRIEMDRRYDAEKFEHLKKMRAELVTKIKSLQTEAYERSFEENPSIMRTMSKSTRDAFAALCDMSKNEKLHLQLIKENGYETMASLLRQFDVSDVNRIRMCGEFFCNLSHNSEIGQKLLNRRVVEVLLHCAKCLDDDVVFACRVARSMVTLSAGIKSTEMVVWQKGLQFVVDLSSQHGIILASAYQILFNIVCSSKTKVLPWFRECASVATKVYVKQIDRPLDMQQLLLSVLCHLATFAPLSSAMIGFDIIGKLENHLEGIIANKKYLFHSERIDLVERIALLFYNMSRHIDSASKMADENILHHIRSMLSFIEHHSEQCTQLLLAIIGNVGRSPHGRTIIISNGAVNILRNSSLDGVAAMKKSITDGNSTAESFRLVDLFQDRLRICVEGLLHLSSDEKVVREITCQGALRVLIVVCNMTKDWELLYMSICTVCDLLSTHFVMEIHSVVPQDIEDSIDLLFEIHRKVIEQNKEYLGYMATALRNVTMFPALLGYIAGKNLPVAEIAVSLAYESYPQEDIMEMFSGALYHSSTNTVTERPLCSKEYIKKIIDVMKIAKTPRIDELCLATIQNVTHAFSSAGEIYSEGGALEELVELSDSPDDNTRGLAVSVLCSLSFDESNADPLVKAGAMEALLKVAKTSTRLASRVAAAFNNFCVIKGGVHLNRLIDIGVIPALINIMSSEQPLERRRAAQAVAHMACIETTVGTMLGKGKVVDTREENGININVVELDWKLSNQTSVYMYMKDHGENIWEHVVDGKGVAQLVLTGLLRNSKEHREVSLLCCVAFYTLVNRAGVHHPMHQHIAWGSGQMYSINNMTRDMANRILINLTVTVEGRLIVKNGNVLRSAAETILRQENETKLTEEPTLQIYEDIIQLFYNIFLSKEGRFDPMPVVLEAIIQFVEDYAYEFSQETRKRIMTLLCVFASNSITSSVFIMSRGFSKLVILFDLCKKDKIKLTREEFLEFNRQGVIAAFTCSFYTKSKDFAALDGALDRLLLYDPRDFDLLTKKLVSVALFNYTNTDDEEIRYYLAKRGGIKIPRDFLEASDLSSTTSDNLQQIFSRTAYKMSFTSLDLRSILLEKGIARILLACSTSKKPEIANEVATALCRYSQVQSGLVHLVQGEGVKLVDNLLRNGARSFFHPTTQDTYLKAAIALGNMSCHAHSRARLIRDKIFAVFQRLCSGSTNRDTVATCSKSILLMSASDAACKEALTTRGVMETFLELFESTKSGQGMQYREAEKRLAFAIKQFSRDNVLNLVPKKLVKESEYAMKLMAEYLVQPKMLDHLSKGIDPDNPAWLEMIPPPTENLNDVELSPVFHKHNKIPKAPLIVGEALSIGWAKHTYATAMEESEEMELMHVPKPIPTWSKRKENEEAKENENSDNFHKALPAVVDVNNVLIKKFQDCLTRRYVCENEEKLYNSLKAGQEKLKTHQINLKKERAMIQSVKSLAKVVIDKSVIAGMACEELRRVESRAEIARQIELKRLAAMPLEPIKSPTRRPSVTPFSSFSTLLSKTTERTPGGIHGTAVVSKVNILLSPIKKRDNRIVKKYVAEAPQPNIGAELKKTKCEPVTNDARDVDSNDVMSADEYRLLYSRNEQRRHIIDGFATEKGLTPGTKHRISNFFNHKGTLADDDSENESDKVGEDATDIKRYHLDFLGATAIAQYGYYYSRNSQRLHVLEDYVVEKKLTPGMKMRLVDHFENEYDTDERSMEDGMSRKLKKAVTTVDDIRKEEYETYSFGSYSRRYFS